MAQVGRPRRPHRRGGRAGGGRAGDLAPDGARPDRDDEARSCAEGTGTAAALEGVDVAGKTGTAELNTERPQPAVVHVLHARRGGRGHARALPGRHGRRRPPRRSPSPSCRRWGSSRCRGSRATRWSTAATGSSRRIGSGGMADVYCAEDTQLGRQVALKLLYRRFAEDDEFVERFRREASSAAGLQHPNVVQVFDRGEWDGTYYIAMEFLAGPQPQAGRARARRARPGARGRPRDPDPQGGALRAPARDRAPRHQAAQRDRRRRGPREGHRLRDRARRRVGHDRDRLDHGHGAVPLARAGAGPCRSTRAPTSTRSAIVLYELLTGHAAVRRRVAGHDRAQAGLRGAGAAARSSTRPCRRRSTRSCCARCARTRPSASRTPTSSSPRSRRAMAGGYVETVAEDPVAALEEEDRRNWRRIALIALVVLALAALAIGAWLLLTPEKTTRARRRRQALRHRGADAPEPRLRGRRRADPVRHRAPRTASPASGPSRAPRPTRARSSRSPCRAGRARRRSRSSQGLPADEAADELREAGFETEQRREFSDTVPQRPRDRDERRRRARRCARARRSRSSSRAAARRSPCPTSSGRSRDEAERLLERRRAAGGVQRARGRRGRARHGARAGPGRRRRRSPRARPSSSSSRRAPAEVPVPGVIDDDRGRRGRRRSRTPASR